MAEFLKLNLILMVGLSCSSSFIKSEDPPSITCYDCIYCENKSIEAQLGERYDLMQSDSCWDEPDSSLLVQNFLFSKTENDTPSLVTENILGTESEKMRPHYRIEIKGQIGHCLFRNGTINGTALVVRTVEFFTVDLDGRDGKVDSMYPGFLQLKVLATDYWCTSDRCNGAAGDKLRGVGALTTISILYFINIFRSHVGHFLN